MSTRATEGDALTGKSAEQSLSSSLYQIIKSRFSAEPYNEEVLVHPCVVNNVQTLVYPQNLKKENPQAFGIIKQYAEVNGFQLKEDKRSDFLEGVKRVKDTKLANVMRVTSAMTSKKKFSKDALVHPCVIHGVQTLVYPRGLQKSDTAAFQVIKEYALVNGIALKEDNRFNFLEGVKRVKDNKLANVVSVMALSASLSLMSQPAAAGPENSFNLPFFNVADSEHSVAEHDINVNNFHSQAELAQGLIDWLGHHSSFHDGHINAPEIKKVSAYEIAAVAFGGTVPKSVDSESLKIFGLYNFNAKTVYLLDSIDLDSIEGKGILLHELVHYLQYETGLDKNAKCMNELEALAYTLEAKFLDNHDHRHGITNKHIDSISQCHV